MARLLDRTTPDRSNALKEDRTPIRSRVNVVLSTTSYAVLGMLAVRPWSAYELTKQMRRSLAYCWPKAESVLYDEPKRLARLGLATATEHPSGNGSRTRAVYTITDAGRQALGDWLATEPGAPRLELEPLLRLLYADHGSKDDLLRTLATVTAWTRTEAARGLPQLEEYQRDGGPFPDRLHISVLFGDLVSRLVQTLDQWASEAGDEVQGWPDTRGIGATPATLRRLDELVRRTRALLDSAG
jgi:PadR family transcriptional regulator, regulatory protein AphA